MTGIANDEKPAQVVIAGAGIVGLVLALALKKHVGVTAEIYEKAHQFHDDVGAALGMYPNGLRVLRDIDPNLMKAVKDNGMPYLYRRWERHDGTEIAVANEDPLSGNDKELTSIGIRRWKLQKVLYQAVQDAGITVEFAKATSGVVEREDGTIQVLFADGSCRCTQLLFGADGGKSKIRESVAGSDTALEYTGVTCLMGISDCPSERRGISFPSSTTSSHHAVYFPTGPNEQCFQIHFNIDEADADKSNWGNLSIADGKEEFEKLAETMRKDGWHERYVEPLCRVDHAVRVGFALLNPRLERWVYGKNRRIVLVGDSAHPPVPYVGQGAQMGVEDAGTIAVLMKHLCRDSQGNLDLSDFAHATDIYEKLRIPRTGKILDVSKGLGAMQDARARDKDGDLYELFIEGEVLMDDTLSALFPGVTYNYYKDVMEVVGCEKARMKDENVFDDLMQEAELLFGEA